MERSIQKNGLINLLILLAVGTAAFGTARYANALAGQVSSLFLGVSVLVAFVSWFQMRLEEGERLEKLEIEELARTRGSAALFESREAEIFPAQRARQQFERYFVPGFTVLLFLIEAGGTFGLWRWLGRPATPVPLRQPMMALPLFGFFFLVLFLLGRFSATIARLEKQRLLRPGASHLLLGAYLSFLSAGAIAAVQAEFPRADLYLARALCVVLGLIALEALITLVLEIYRPRVKGKVERPLYDSRLVGLLGQPEGLITTVAEALDYQFGFKVSETWFYQFLARHLPTLVLAQLAVLLLSTCVVFIEPGEQGVREHLGRPATGGTILEPGPHLKWPWPVDIVYRYHTDQIQTLDVGFAPAPESEQLRTILWSVPHTRETREENFLVANREPPTAESGTETGRRAPPVSLLTVSIPVQFQITNVLAWAYNNDDPTNLLHRVATREVVRYLVSADVNEIMSHKRQEAAEALRDRIQIAANERALGASIIFVGLEDIHPPVDVAPDYEKVVGAIQRRLATNLAARAEAIRTNALAGAAAFVLTNSAEAERQRLETTWVARAALFTNQIPAFEAAPSVYKQRVYFQAFARATANAKKYILLATNTQDVLIFDLQDKISEDWYKTLAVPTPRK